MTQRNRDHLKEENFKLKKKNRERETVKWKMMKDELIEITKIYYKPCYEKKPTETQTELLSILKMHLNYNLQENL